METDWLKKWAYYTPDKMFLREDNRDIQWSFAEFDNLVSAVSLFLQEKFGITHGDRIAVYSKNRAEYVLLYLSCLRSGAILVPLNFRLTPRELDVLISDAEPKLFLYESEYSEQVKLLQSISHTPYKEPIEEIAPFLFDKKKYPAFQPKQTIAETDLNMILYTAGTTGLPKGVMITHRMLFWNAINTGLRLDLHSADHTQSYAPFFHTGGWNVLFTPFLLHGASHTLLQSFNAEKILLLMEKEKSTILFGVPTMLQMMSDMPLFKQVDLSSVRYAIVGGAPMPIPLINLWHEKGIAIRQGYGLTEVGPNCYSLHQRDAIRKRGSIGFPNFYVDAKIMDEHGIECPDNTIGELWMKSPIVTPGYWRKEKETKESITDGYFHTGDLVTRDSEGYYYVVDRKKNMFISGGENVYPAEIEAILYKLNAIKETAVIGVEDEKWGEVGKAFVVFKEGETIDTDQIMEHCRQNLAKYKIPKHIQCITAIPKTDAGKINRKELLSIHQQTLSNQSK